MGSGITIDTEEALIVIMIDMSDALNALDPNWHWQSMMRNDRAHGEADPSDTMRSSSAAF